MTKKFPKVRLGNPAARGPGAHHFAGGQPVGEDQGLLSNGGDLPKHLVEHRKEPLALPLLSGKVMVGLIYRKS